MVLPILANILGHYVIDEWFEKTVKEHCQGKVALFRYCDDLVICSQNSTDARRIKLALGRRLAKFKLRMNEEKTKLVEFDRRHAQKTSFNFLGFTFYWGRSNNGYKIPKVKTEGRRMRTKLKNVTYGQNRLGIKEMHKKFGGPSVRNCKGIPNTMVFLIMPNMYRSLYIMQKVLCNTG